MNIDVRLNLLGVLDVKRSDLSLEAPQDCTVARLIDQIDQYNSGFKTALMGNEGSISSQFVLFINGRNAMSLDGAMTRLKDGDVVNIIPAIAGG